MKINFKLKKKNIQYIGFSVIIIGLIFVMYSFFSYQFNEYNTIEGLSMKSTLGLKSPDDVEEERLDKKSKEDDEYSGEDQEKRIKLKKKKKIKQDQEKDEVKKTKELNGNIRQQISSIDDNIEELKLDTDFSKNKDLYLKYLTKSREELLLKKLQEELNYSDEIMENRSPFMWWQPEEKADLESLLSTNKVRPASDFFS